MGLIGVDSFSSWSLFIVIDSGLEPKEFLVEEGHDGHRRLDVGMGNHLPCGVSSGSPRILE
jgi:hypothetical protein